MLRSTKRWRATDQLSPSQARYSFRGMEDPPFTLIEANAIHEAFSDALAEAKEREDRMPSSAAALRARAEKHSPGFATRSWQPCRKNTAATIPHHMTAEKMLYVVAFFSSSWPPRLRLKPTVPDSDSSTSTGYA